MSALGRKRTLATHDIFTLLSRVRRAKGSLRDANYGVTVQAMPCLPRDYFGEIGKYALLAKALKGMVDALGLEPRTR